MSDSDDDSVVVPLVSPDCSYIQDCSYFRVPNRFRPIIPAGTTVIPLRTCNMVIPPGVCLKENHDILKCQERMNFSYSVPNAMKFIREHHISAEIDWMVALHFQRDFHPPALHLAVNIFRRHIYQRPSMRLPKLRFATIVCLMVASKFDEDLPLNITDCAKCITDCACSGCDHCLHIYQQVSILRCCVCPMLPRGLTVSFLIYRLGILKLMFCKVWSTSCMFPLLGRL